MEALIYLVGEVAGLCVLTDVHVELCYLVSVHAWCWDLDGARPVEVVVAQIERQFLNDLLLERRVVKCNVEVSRENTALGC